MPHGPGVPVPRGPAGGAAQIQLKTLTFRTEDPLPEMIDYSISTQLYDHLRGCDNFRPRVLVVMLVPPEPDNWVHQGDTALEIRRCAFWISLQGNDPVTTNTHTVHIPTTHVLDVDALCTMLYRARYGLSLGDL